MDSVSVILVVEYKQIIFCIAGGKEKKRDVFTLANKIKILPLVKSL